MSHPDPVLDDVVASYERALIAMVQLREFAGWGSMNDFFRREIDQHHQLEEAYIASVIAARRKADDEARDHPKT